MAGLAWYEGHSVREVVRPRGSERKHDVSDQTHGPTRLSPDPPGPLGALVSLLLTLNPRYLHRLMVALTAPWPSQSVPQLGVPHPVPLPHGHKNVTHPTDYTKTQFLMPSFPLLAGWAMLSPPLSSPSAGSSSCLSVPHSRPGGGGKNLGSWCGPCAWPIILASNQS